MHVLYLCMCRCRASAAAAVSARLFSSELMRLLAAPRNRPLTAQPMRITPKAKYVSEALVGCMSARHVNEHIVIQEFVHLQQNAV